MQARRTQKKTPKHYPRSPLNPELTPVYVRTFSPNSSTDMFKHRSSVSASASALLPPPPLSLHHLPEVEETSRRASDAVLPPSRTGTVLLQGYVPLYHGPYPTSIGILPRPLSPPLRSCSPRSLPPPPPSPSKSKQKRSCSTGLSPPLACRELSEEAIE